jgi:hypothetical protein
MAWKSGSTFYVIRLSAIQKVFAFSHFGFNGGPHGATFFRAVIS